MHIPDIDKILGDGNCLFRALAKEITGSQEYHFEVRLAIVNFIQCDKHPPTFSKYVVKEFEKQSELTNPLVCQAACKEYIEKSKMSKLRVWGSDIEIRAAATMLQVDVAVFSTSGPTRVWLSFSPLYMYKEEETSTPICMPNRGFTLYLYHTRSGDHYNRVVPVIK